MLIQLVDDTTEGMSERLEMFLNSRFHANECWLSTSAHHPHIHTFYCMTSTSEITWGYELYISA